MSRKVVPQRGLMTVQRCTSRGVSGAAGLVGVDRLVLGAVVAEDAPDLGHAPDQRQVAEQQGQADGAFEQVADPVGGDVVVGPADQQQGRDGRRRRRRRAATWPSRPCTPTPAASM